jgi:metallo-beta-lactamase class B
MQARVFCVLLEWNFCAAQNRICFAKATEGIAGMKNLRIVIRVVMTCFLLSIAAGTVQAQASYPLQELNQPASPFRIMGNIYYVGASDIASYLIHTPAGDIVLDGGLVQTAPQIEANIKTLGFKMKDVKILLNSHVHFDHAGGLAELKKSSGASLVAMDIDSKQLERGGHGDFFFGDADVFPAVTPNRLIRDGDTVSLGGTTLTAHLTAGHTRGCTTWTMTAKKADKDYSVVFVCSASVLNGYQLVARPGHPTSYPGIAEDYENSFRVWKSLPCDVFLGAHGQFFNLTEKSEALKNGAQKNPFIDPSGYQAHVSQKEMDFQKELDRQKALAPNGDKPPPKN